ncbi:hypothetical protein I302_100698 [Kwoniella bestiolae CBS 10118]|uniref:Protein YOP1 n=1 Tax=Kwoniella bestiolae CBS 10118 TaxID=1296100 RepID=A0A1B9G5V7_9TREE|nr:hypothetical protein I302_04073 [Kwoniella bestiolae CBS 10118]OCF26390.1 hypothetical protein I302_04073 [Kwoniella bestiolae CBS 10118]
MDPTTSAHIDPFAGPNSDLTSKQPAVSDTSGLATSTVPSSGLGNAPQLGAAHTSQPSGFNNPFVSSSPPVVPTNTIPQNYPDTQVYPSTNTNTNGQSDFADIHARSAGLGGTTSDKGYSDSQLNSTSQTVNDKVNVASNKASETATQASNKANQVSGQAQQKANEAATGIRQRVRKLSVDLNNAADHPAVKNVKGTANNYIAQLREQLGRSQTVRDLEKRTGVDRVALVVGGVLGYILLVPLNVLRLALPITNILTILPATYLAALTLDKPDTTANDRKVKSLLSYFVVLGAIQTIESLMAGFLERKIPQYYTVKLLFLAYLLHPRTQGALQVHERVFQPILASAQQSAKSAPPPSSTSNTYGAPKSSSQVSTPPTSKPSLSTVNSPTQPQSSGFTTMAASIPLPGESENITRADARGQGYSVVSELH